MQPAESFSSEELIGRHVVFRTGDDHAACWHQRVGLERGRVLKQAATLAQKMEMLGPDAEMPDEFLEDYEEVPRVWVKAEPTDNFPHGCEAVIDVDCLLVEDGK